MSCGDSSTGVRMRDEQGFGLVELLAAMMVLMIGILALFAMFESGIRTIKRASTVTTAGALADREMENFRAIRYDSIGLPDGLVTAAASPYASDPAYQATAANRVALNACGTAPCTTKVPVQTLTGADGKSYRVDTYVTWQTDRGRARGEARHDRRPRRGQHDQGLGPDRVVLRRLDRRVAVNAAAAVFALAPALALGSFLNVVVARVPARRSLLRPPSSCGSCEQEILWRDNIPVLSYLLLRGRCRHCSARISPLYPAVEAATAVLAVACVAVFGPTAYGRARGRLLCAPRHALGHRRPAPDRPQPHRASRLRGDSRAHER